MRENHRKKVVSAHVYLADGQGVEGIFWVKWLFLLILQKFVSLLPFQSFGKKSTEPSWRVIEVEIGVCIDYPFYYYFAL